jgi:hypothetical protein
LAPNRVPGYASLRPLPRAAVYGLAGCFAELIFTACSSVARTRQFHPRTSPLMLPIYGLTQPLFEPVHQAMRGRVPPCGRALIYGSGFHLAEYVSGRLLRRLLGRAPWDYSNARWQLDGLIRFDYFPLWAAAGLMTERLHDILMAPPSIRMRRPVPAFRSAAASANRAGERPGPRRGAPPGRHAAQS